MPGQECAQELARCLCEGGDQPGTQAHFRIQEIYFRPGARHCSLAAACFLSRPGVSACMSASSLPWVETAPTLVLFHIQYAVAYAWLCPLASGCRETGAGS